MVAASGGAGRPQGDGAPKLSYKFQRVRERMRQAIVAGAIKGKLPGERELSRMFHANPKTLGKALTDLAAEGLLERRIGRGTYTNGTSPPAPTADGRWLIITEQPADRCALLREILANHAECDVHSNGQPLRPSFLDKFDAVIDLAPHTPEHFVRDMAVRAMPVVLIDHTPQHIMSHAVVIDRRYAAFLLGRDLVFQGHKTLFAIEDRQPSDIRDGLAQAAVCYGKGVKVAAWGHQDLERFDPPPGSAVVCSGSAVGEECREVLLRRRSIPQEVSLAVVGCCEGVPQVTGYYVDARAMVRTLVELMKNLPPRPGVVYMMGTYLDRGTAEPRKGC